jgi:uncharacterized small protein (DUF1192 family)
MSATIDNESISGAWLREWLAQSHSNQEWRLHIQEQQERINAYLEQIERLNRERNEMLLWQFESSQTEMKLRAEIERLKKELARA